MCSSSSVVAHSSGNAADSLPSAICDVHDRAFILITVIPGVQYLCTTIEVHRDECGIESALWIWVFERVGGSSRWRVVVGGDGERGWLDPVWCASVAKQGWVSGQVIVQGAALGPQEKDCSSDGAETASEAGCALECGLGEWVEAVANAFATTVGGSKGPGEDNNKG